MSGAILWEGPSRIDGAPIVAIITGIGDRKSDRTSNAKIGSTMIQTWMLLQDIPPIEAINTGADQSICGSCALRGIIATTKAGTVNRSRGCYVSVQNAPNAIWHAYQAGKYPYLTDESWPGRPVRLGAYGDPASIPYQMNMEVIKRGNGKNVGYSSQWRDRKFQPMRKLCMASVRSTYERLLARRKGWRTFRSMLPDEKLEQGEFMCPASAEMNYRLTCDNCMACNGVGMTRENAASVAIYAHGSKATMSGYLQSIGNT